MAYLDKTGLTKLWAKIKATYEIKKTTTTVYSSNTGIYTSAVSSGNVKTATITLTSSVKAGDKLKVYVYGGSSYPTYQAGIIELTLYSPTSTTLVGQGCFTSVSGGQKLIVTAEINSTSAATTSSLKINVYTLAASDYAAASYVYVNKVERIR